MYANKTATDCKDREIRALRTQLVDKNHLFSVDDEVLKANTLNENLFNELKLIDHSIELLSYFIEPEEFNEINKINDDVQVLEDVTRTETKDQMNNNLQDLKISENPEIESIESENDFEEEDAEPEKPVDVDFLIYKNNLLNDPEHVIRYCFNSQTVPMFYSLYGKFSIDDLPNCELCGSKRIFEFQVNNTLLNSVEGLYEMDWGIITVYSCSNSCFSENPYVKEVVRVQREVYDTRDFKVEPKNEVAEEIRSKNNKKKKPKKKKTKKAEKNEFDVNNWS